MIYLTIIVLILLAAFICAVITAPIGYQDETGFHLGIEGDEWTLYDVYYDISNCAFLS